MVNFLDLRSRVGQLRSAVQTLVLGGNGSEEAIRRLKHARPGHGCPPWCELEEQIALIDSVHTMSRQAEKNLRSMITRITDKTKAPTTCGKGPSRKVLLGWAMKHPRQILEICDPFHPDDEPGVRITIAKEAGLDGASFYKVFAENGIVYYEGGSIRDRLSSPFFEHKTILQFAAWMLSNLRACACLAPNLSFEVHPVLGLMVKDLSEELVVLVAKAEGIDRTDVEEVVELYRVMAERFCRGDSDPFGFGRRS